jgi:Ca2+-transporting ATPase
MLKRSIGLGACVMIWTVGVYGAALHWLDDPTARALAFATMVFANVSLIFVSRSRSGSVRVIVNRHNNIFWIMAAFACVALALVVYVPSVAQIFRFTPPAWELLTTVAIATVVLVLIAGRWLAISPPALATRD